jgi:hypothetical protein
MRAIVGLLCLTPAMLGNAPLSTATPQSCAARERPLFACPIGTRVVSVCHGPAGATYRYGRPGKSEIKLNGGRFAQKGYSGGGESQLRFDQRDFTYVVFDRTIRTGFGSDGRNNPRFDAGLLVLNKGKVVSMRLCGGVGDQVIAASAAKLLPPGAFVEH